MLALCDLARHSRHCDFELFSDQANLTDFKCITAAVPIFQPARFRLFTFAAARHDVTTKPLIS